MTPPPNTNPPAPTYPLSSSTVEIFDPPCPIADLPPELLGMIAEHLAQHGAGLDGREYFDMRGGCRSLSNFYQSCRYIKDCVAPTFWEVVVARDDVNIPERYMPLVKCISVLHTYKQPARDGLRSKRLSYPGINTVSSFYAEEIDPETEEVFNLGWILDIRLPSTKGLKALRRQILDLAGEPGHKLNENGGSDDDVIVIAVRIHEVSPQITRQTLRHLGQIMGSGEGDSISADLFYPIHKRDKPDEMDDQLKQLLAFVESWQTIYVMVLKDASLDFFEILLRFIQLFGQVTLELTGSAIVDRYDDQFDIGFITQGPTCAYKGNDVLIPNIWSIVKAQGWSLLHCHVYCEHCDERHLLCWTQDEPAHIPEERTTWSGMSGNFPLWTVGEEEDNLHVSLDMDADYEVESEESDDEDGEDDMGELEEQYEVEEYFSHYETGPVQQIKLKE